MADRNSIICQKSVANTPSILTDTTGIPANEARAAWSIQNVGTNPLFVSLGGTASSTVFHYVLKGGTGDSDGLGALVGQTAGTVFTGKVSVAGTSPKYVVMEI
jgi:hypothetical protein